MAVLLHHSYHVYPKSTQNFFQLLRPENIHNNPALPEIQNSISDGLASYELFWRDQYSWLKERGYMLRPRYAPDWTPSWKGTDFTFLDCEDGIRPPGYCVLDAIRISDGLPVLIKRKEPVHEGRRDDLEMRMFQKFSSEPLVSDPKNHCVRLIEILHVPGDENIGLIVMPLLFPWNIPQFQTIGEAVEFLTQIFEGLQFMHENRVWHRDCKYNNIMMDASPLHVSPRDVHPVDSEFTRDMSGKARCRTRTERPVKYYLIDFDLSGEWEPATAVAGVAWDPVKMVPLTDPLYGGIMDVPEFLAHPNDKCNPLAVDFWCLGKTIKEILMFLTTGKKRPGFEFMEELVEKMCCPNPEFDPTSLIGRPTMDQVVADFSKIRAKLTESKLRSRFVDDEFAVVGATFRSMVHRARQLQFMLRSLPAIPSPR